MKIEEIISLLENKLDNLSILKSMAITNGDIESVAKLDSDIKETEESLFILKK